MTENPLVNLGDLAKPATVLIEKISDAVGGVWKPYQIVRVAEAEAEAERIRAESQIQVTDLHRRALHRFLEEEAKRQSNIEGITLKALPHLTEDSSPQNVEDDWITNFFDKCRIVSDDDMQKLWSRVLAGEANSPGTFSRKTVNLLTDLNKVDAELFVRLCSFCWVIAGSYRTLVYNYNHSIYNRRSVDFGTLSHLDDLGFVKFNPFVTLYVDNLQEVSTFYYYDKQVELLIPPEYVSRFYVGHVALTRAGQELVPICESKPIDEFFDYIWNEWKRKGLTPIRPQSEFEQDAPTDG